MREKGKSLGHVQPNQIEINISFIANDGNKCSQSYSPPPVIIFKPTFHIIVYTHLNQGVMA